MILYYNMTEFGHPQEIRDVEHLRQINIDNNNKGVFLIHSFERGHVIKHKWKGVLKTIISVSGSTTLVFENVFKHKKDCGWIEDPTLSNNMLSIPFSTYPHRVKGFDILFLYNQNDKYIYDTINGLGKPGAAAAGGKRKSQRKSQTKSQTKSQRKSQRKLQNKKQRKNSKE